ncbi:MAG: glycosyltransferase [Bacteroidaceae bacterium]|nr:glycosyltransferase [Bacteroidaceae bacterium]
MYILVISRGYPSKEYPQWGCFEKDQAEALAEYGHKVVVISVDARFADNRGKPGLHRFENNGVVYYNYVAVPGVFFYKWMGSYNYRRFISLHCHRLIYERVCKEIGKPDLLYSHYIHKTFIGALLKKRYNVPLVGIEHLSKFNETVIPSSLDKEARFAYGNVDSLICVSKTLSLRLKQLYGVDSTVIYNMYGAEFESLEQDIKSFSDDFVKPFVFVSTASLIKRKGFDALINAFALANLDKKQWIMNIIGEGEEKANLEYLIRKFDLQNNVFLLGRMSKIEIVSHLRKSDAFVLTSRNENFSVAVLEALATGLPVVATACGGIRECVNENNGIIVAVDDIKAIAAALKRMIENYSSYNRELIAEDCKSRFSPHAIASQLTDVFDKVLASRLE